MTLDLATISEALPGFIVERKPGKIVVRATSGRSAMRIEIPESALNLSLEEFGNRWLKPAFIAMGGLEVSMKSVARDRRAAGLGPVGVVK